MIKVTLIALGKLKEKYLVEAVNEYKKRLSGYCNLEIVELEPVKLSDKPSQKEIDSALLKEAAEISKKIPQNSAVYPFCVEGKELSSPDFAKEISACANEGKSIVFIIGSSYGLDQTVKNLGKKRLSVSEMTFPHQLFRVMALEQIYRAFKINEGSAYHK
jgi:23S rRNA (pseudouridine1915-N3)-methyltransferase